MDLNPILHGWLTKSPPDRKTRPFKLFKAKWRRRYFVLYEPLASQSLPGTRAALDYYNNGRYQKKLGTIDLDHCEEVLCKLDSPYHNNVFSLRTKHKGRDRTYYLSAESEQDMMKWVDCLCLALGLKENNESVPQSGDEPATSPPRQQQQQQQQQVVESSPTSQYVVARSAPTTATKQKSYRDVHPDQPTLASEGQLTLAHLAGSNRQPSPRLVHQDPPNYQPEAYIPLEDCYTGERHSITPSLAHLGDKYAHHRASRDSIPSELAPAPPVKSGRKLSVQDVVPPVDPSVYDDPKKSYVNLDDNENIYKVPRGDATTPDEGFYKIPRRDSMDMEGIYKIPRGEHSDDEGLYKMPRHTRISTSADEDEGIYKIPKPTKSPTQRNRKASLKTEVGVPDQEPFTEGWYDVPPSQAPAQPSSERVMRNSNSSSDSHGGYSDHSFGSPGELYDVPKHLNQGYTASDYRNSNTLSRTSHFDIYDAPKPCRKTVSENNLLESVVPPPSKSQPPMPIPESRYENLPPNSKAFNHDQRVNAPQVIPPKSRSYANSQHLMYDDMYDIPPNRARGVDPEKLLLSPPPPKPCQSIKHSYINAQSPYLNENQRRDSNSSFGGIHSPVPAANSSSIPPVHGVHESFYMPMSTSMELRESAFSEGLGEVYTDMKTLAGQEVYSVPPSNRPVNPSVHDVVPPPSKTKAFIEPPNGSVFEGRDDTYSVFMTQRTRSFKRPTPIGTDVMLPTRRTGTLPSNDSSSDDDDDESSSGGSHDKSADSLSYKHPSAFHNQPLIPGHTGSLSMRLGSLNCTPPPPKRQGEVQYLDLALDKDSDSEKSPLSTRSTAPGNISPTDYKEIDFVKTKALNEMQKDVESKRKSSERSMDE